MCGSFAKPFATVWAIGGVTRSATDLPMDEGLYFVRRYLSGRGMLVWDVAIGTEKVGSFDTELVKEFWLAFARTAECTLHLRKLAGENSHHIIEAVFKAAARSLKQAVSLSGLDDIPSTKGVL